MRGYQRYRRQIALARNYADRGSSGSDRGSVVLLAALMMVLLLGFLALAVDASFVVDTRHRLHAAADAGAKSAAIELRTGNSDNIDAYVEQVIDEWVAAGDLPASAADPGNRIVRLCSAGGATCTGSYAGNANYVEVILQTPIDTFFGRALGVMSMTPVARAVAGFESVPNPNCLIALGGPGAPSYALSLSGTAQINATSCNVYANGGLTLSGTAGVTAASLNLTTNIRMSGVTDITASSVSASSCSDSGLAACPPLQPAAAPVADPLASVPQPADPGGSCTNVSFSGVGARSYGPPGSAICNLSTSGTVSLTLEPGVYYVRNNVSLSGTSSIGGAGVMIYIHNGSLSVSGTASAGWSAPTSGTYAGIAVFQRRGNTNDAQISGVSSVTGALYMPTADVEASGVSFSGASDCRIIIARSFTNSGTSTLNNGCEDFGGSPLSGAGGGGDPVSIAE